MHDIERRNGNNSSTGKSLESFGEHSRRVLLFHIAERFGIGDRCAITLE